jgi:L-glyceraldehyde 3-phosphate reductase
MEATPNPRRYDTMTYNRCGKSGLKLPALSLGLWHNFGGVDDFDNGRAIIRKAFDSGITHIDLANNYGPPPGSAEETFGQVLKRDLMPYRDELIVSTKAGYRMWPGPYGEWGSRKYLVASLDQSLKRTGLEYVDIYYSHRFDPETPLEETMAALDYIVRSGKALYAGISNYGAEHTEQAFAILKELGTPCVIHQAKYSMFERWVEKDLLDVLERNGTGCIAFSPLAQGLLTNKYLNGIPEGSRASKPHGFLKPGDVTPERLLRIRKLNDLAGKRGQTLARMAVSWLLKDTRITSVLIGVSRPDQIDDCLGALDHADFTSADLIAIDEILS